MFSHVFSLVFEWNSRWEVAKRSVLGGEISRGRWDEGRVLGGDGWKGCFKEREISRAASNYLLSYLFLTISLDIRV